MLMAVLGHLPYAWMGRLGRAFGVFVYHLAGGERRKTIRNIQTAFPRGMSAEKIEKLALSVWARLGWNIFEVIRWIPMTQEAVVSKVARIRGWENMEKALQHQKGVI